MDSLSFTGNRESSLFLQPVNLTSSFYQQPRPGGPQNTFLPPNLFQIHPCSPSSRLFLNYLFLSPSHPPSYLPIREAAGEGQGISQLCCCYSNRSKESAVLQQTQRNPNASFFELSLPFLSNPNWWALQTEEARTQPACELFSRPVRLAGLAVIVVESLTGRNS